MPLFSIVTVCRNNLTGLIETFESVKSQDFKDFEWIVVDGDSSDGTIDWIKTVPFDFIWISEKDKGIFDAMNKGIRLSKGNYLIFMNSGDAFADSNVLSKIHEILSDKKSEPLFIYGDSWDIDENGRAHYRLAKDHKLIKRGMITQHQAVLFNHFKVPDLNYSMEYPLTADYAFICEVIKRCKTVDILKVNFAICKFSLGGTNESARFNAIKEDFYIRREILKMSLPEAVILYILHYIHTVFKKIAPSTRFLKLKCRS